MDVLLAKKLIRRRFDEYHGHAEIPLRKGRTIRAELKENGIQVDNLGTQPLLPWEVFQEAVCLLVRNGGRAPKGNAMNNRLGDEGLAFDSVEGHVAQVVYGKKPGDWVFRRISPIAGILRWAGVCRAARGELILVEDHSAQTHISSVESEINPAAICQQLKNLQQELVRTPKNVRLVDDKDANDLLVKFGEFPHAFVIGCLVDRQQPADKCWIIPHRLKKRAGTFKFEDLEKIPLEKMRELIDTPEPLHRFPATMAKVIYRAIRQIREKYQGDASRIWSDTPSSKNLVSRFKGFYGAGQKISTMAANILVREFGIKVRDQQSIDVSVDRQVKRVFQRLGLVRDEATNQEIIDAARRLNPEYPGVFDLPSWEIGRKWCHPQNPDCASCIMGRDCLTSARSKR